MSNLVCFKEPRLDFWSIFSNNIRSMVTNEEILEWMEQNSITKKELAERLHISYHTLRKALSGHSKLGNFHLAYIEEMMKEPKEGLQVIVPPDMEQFVIERSKELGISVNEYVNRVLRALLNI